MAPTRKTITDADVESVEEGVSLCTASCVMAILIAPAGFVFVWAWYNNVDMLWATCFLVLLCMVRCGGRLQANKLALAQAQRAERAARPCGAVYRCMDSTTLSCVFAAACLLAFVSGIIGASTLDYAAAELSPDPGLANVSVVFYFISLSLVIFILLVILADLCCGQCVNLKKEATSSAGTASAQTLPLLETTAVVVQP